MRHVQDEGPNQCVSRRTIGEKKKLSAPHPSMFPWIIEAKDPLVLSHVLVLYGTEYIYQNQNIW